MGTYQQEKRTFVSFFLGTELFALDAMQILEIVRKEKITIIPKTSEYIRGIISFRGEIIPVFDPYLKFNIEGVDEVKKREIIVLEYEHESQIVHFGILAEKINEVEFLLDSDIQDVASIGKGFDAELVSGTFKSVYGYANIIDVAKLL